MANLREDVEKLRLCCAQANPHIVNDPYLKGSARATCDFAIQLQSILDRHPAADGVVVPRELLDDLAYAAKCTANEMKRQMDSESGDPDGSLEESALHLDQLAVQAGAILSTKAGP